VRALQSICLMAAGIICLSTISASSQENSTDAPGSVVNVKVGDVVSNYFHLLAADPAVHSDCDFILASLNRPKIYDLGEEWDLLLGTEYNYIWQRRSSAADSWSYPLTTGDVSPRLKGEDQLVVDIDGDGAPETFSRVAALYHGQVYTALSVHSKSLPKETLNALGENEIAIKDVKSQPPLNIDLRTIGADFYLIDLLNVQGRTYVIATPSVIDTAESQLPDVIVFAFGKKLSLNAVCHFALIATP
jgi:hypothetical protein